jgi:hypothetical protein
MVRLRISAVNKMRMKFEYGKKQGKLISIQSKSFTIKLRYQHRGIIQLPLVVADSASFFYDTKLNKNFYASEALDKRIGRCKK